MDDRNDHVMVRILATTDLHAHILPWDDMSDQPAFGRGIAQVASLITAARAEEPNALLFDNGDFLNGSPLGDYVAQARNLSRKTPHPMIAIMNALGYDAAALGNHEFSNGLNHLQRALLAAAFPVLSANLFRKTPSGRRRFLPPFVVLKRVFADAKGQSHEIRVGVVGFLPPQTVRWEAGNLNGRFETQDILETARTCVRQMRKAGADIIVALCHSGVGTLDARAGEENVSLALASVAGIDAVIGGHTHQTYPDCDQSSDAGAAPLVSPGFFGSHLGVIDLQLRRGENRWQVAGHSAGLRPIATRSEDGARMVATVLSQPDVVALGAKDHAAFVKHAARVIATSDTPLQSYFALIGQSAVQDLLAASQTLRARRLLCGTAHAGLPVLAAVAPFKAGGRAGPENYTDIAAGPLSLRNIFDLYIHPNTAVILCLTRAEIALWLERSASMFCRVAPGAQDASLVDPAFPAYNFDMIHGLDYCIDLSRPRGFNAAGEVENATAGRITDLRYQGNPVLPDQKFVLASNSYRVSGGAGFCGADDAHVIAEDRQSLRQVLETYVRDQASVAPAATGPWRFVPMPGTTVTLDSSPRAVGCFQCDKLTPLGLQPSGFMRFRLAL